MLSQVSLNMAGCLASRPSVLVVCVAFFIVITLVGSAYRQREDEFSKFKSRMHAKQVEDLHLKAQKNSESTVIHFIPKSPVNKDAWSQTEIGEQLRSTGTITTGSQSNLSYANQFYNLSMTLAQPNAHYSNLAKVHIIRVPKASSSSLSAIARRAVGCTPPGPCCRYPGEPKGSCPTKELSKCQDTKRVIGCTDHFPLIWYLFEPRVPSISMMRNPFSRSISAFFYPGIHHNSDCTSDTDTCFVEYTRNVRWQNVVVKMLTGSHAYSPTLSCERNSTCHSSLQLALQNLPFFTFMGVSELWEISLLVLHQKFPSLAPNLQEFMMGTQENLVTKGTFFDLLVRT